MNEYTNIQFREESMEVRRHCIMQEVKSRKNDIVIVILYEREILEVTVMITLILIKKTQHLILLECFMIE